MDQEGLPVNATATTQDGLPALDDFPLSPFVTYEAWSQSTFDLASGLRLDEGVDFPASDPNLDPLLAAPRLSIQSLVSAPNGTYRDIQPNPMAESSSPAVPGPTGHPYFVEKVDFPFISTFDGENWTRIKRYMVMLSARSSVVASAISAVEALYEAEELGNETSNAVALYYTAKSEHARLLRFQTPDLEVTFIVMALLACFEVVSQQDTVPTTMKSEGDFVIKLERWIQQRPWPPVVCRIETWLKLLHVKALHLGGRGFMSTKVCLLFAHKAAPTPSLIFLDRDPPPASILYDGLASPLFEFYIQTQQIGAAICGLNRHHRSRGTLADESEVDQMALKIRQQLSLLRQQAPSLLRLSPVQLQSLVPESLLEQLSTLIDLCNAAYQIEIVDLGRAHGQWLTPTPEAQEALRQVRRIVDENVTRNNGAVNPGFMWPIFFYALEADQEGGNWAVQMLQCVHKPIYQSDFMSRFLAAVVELQCQRSDRVDCRYLCTQRFGVAPPFI
ncbi:uncharacterized protein PV07_10923 [Cladophialophora immunda]|uniref:Transcription factor domain-containing protein n=1 Tax=Cladophialophora immunda TaxID=569365 RepID=A0A0D1Z4W1_9EURO|nr:uncharacterized protein PV07_10923 [Cladophialophora immunda]KIW22646.1 hypothetical protein PV07_10923 [Cladophialophora immunda]OQV08878.1 hypothetical protein CLAIMM_13092 [Cladophialophora immunda]